MTAGFAHTKSVVMGEGADHLPVAAALMPQELKDKGWKLDRRTINDDDVVFIAGNEDLAHYTGRYKDPDEAIAGTIILQSREDGKPLTPKQAAAELKRMRQPAAPTNPTAEANEPQFVPHSWIR